MSTADATRAAAAVFKPVRSTCVFVCVRAIASACPCHDCCTVQLCSARTPRLRQGTVLRLLRQSTAGDEAGSGGGSGRKAGVRVSADAAVLAAELLRVMVQGACDTWAWASPPRRHTVSPPGSRGTTIRRSGGGGVGCWRVPQPDMSAAASACACCAQKRSHEPQRCLRQRRKGRREGAQAQCSRWMCVTCHACCHSCCWTSRERACPAACMRTLRGGFMTSDRSHGWLSCRGA